MNEHVVLVHGLWMHGALMRWMAGRIERAGYTVHRYNYPSVRMNLAENARRLAAFCQALGVPRLHLVGHSLGGLLIARMLGEMQRPDVARVVFLGVPFGGSHAARRLGRVRVGAMAMGASIGEWLDSAQSGGLEGHDIGVIAGDRGMGLGKWVAPDLPAPHDGTVNVSETVVPGARDRIVLPVNHSEMVVSVPVVRQVIEYLRRGRFARSDGARP